MRTARKVKELPKVTIDRQIPKQRKGKVIWPFMCPGQNAEGQCIIGVVATIAARKGKWSAVDDTTLFNILHTKWDFLVSIEKIEDTLWQMANDGLLELVEYKNLRYIIPKTALVDTLDKCLAITAI